jgi:ABC-type polysaccharide/polyol phosphate export permease
MSQHKKSTELFLFFREGMFYPVEIPREQVLANVELNPGTLKVEDIQGNIVWRPQ